MKQDIALAAALASGLAYVIVVGVSTSARAPAPGFVDPPVAMLARFADSGRILRINNPTQMGMIARWLDAAFENPRSKFDLRLLPPPSNELEIRFESGEAVTIFFSGSSSSNYRTETLRQIHETQVLYVVQFEGTSYTIDGVPKILAGYLQLAERKRVPLRKRRARSRYRHMAEAGVKAKSSWPIGMIDHVEPDDEDEFER